MESYCLNEANYEDLISKTDSPILIECWSNWCGPCKMQLPIVEALASEFRNELVVAKLNVVENPELTSRLFVMHLPTLIVMKSGKEIGRKTGLMPILKLKETLTSFGLKNMGENTLV
jgi:thioredoxin 1